MLNKGENSLTGEFKRFWRGQGSPAALSPAARRTIVLLVFVIGGVFGFLYEEIFYRIDLGYFVKRGTTFGPWIPIYGFGALLILASARGVRFRPLSVFFVSMVVCGALEFFSGYVLDHVFAVRLWDYNTEIWNWLSVGGYICLRSVLFFGLSGLFLCCGVLPFLIRLSRRCSEKRLYLISVILSGLFAADIIVSQILLWLQ